MRWWETSAEEVFHRRLIDAADAVRELDISILNAGIYLPGLTWEVPAEQWARQIDVNFWGVAHSVRAALPGMIERGKRPHRCGRLRSRSCSRRRGSTRTWHPSTRSSE